jgi:hypothetical protein
MSMAKTARKISDFEKLIESKRSGPDDVSIYWFVARGSVLKGPFSQTELQDKISSGEITTYDYAWRQGFHEWRPLGSLPEIDSFKKDIPFENYPGLPVPGQSAQQTSPTRNEETSNAPKKRKDVEVRLRTANKQWLSPRQATLFVVFAIFVSWVTNLWFQKQVLRNVSTFFQSKSAGRTAHLGESSAHAVSPEFWAPLFSAPSYPDVKNDIKLPVRTYGVGQWSKDEYKIRDQKIDVHPLWVEQEIKFSEIDPIFVRPVEVSGHLNTRDPAHLKVKQLGEPFLENRWEN